LKKGIEKAHEDFNKDKSVKQELNYISESENEDPDQSCSIVPPITVAIELDGQVTSIATTDAGASANVMSTRFVERNPDLKCRPAKGPSSLHQPLSKKPIPISEEVVAKVDIPSQGIKTEEPTVFKVAPLVSKDVILRMPFLANNELLINCAD
jgi:Retroviral aspartyl protease